ncbi:MAG TPA: helix-turn-helix domain-containing protein [Pseudonocardiaceae bacterium]|nr:helix-turn-helix domain-containing protein [Pseudonocardiaceae bacterium]
MDSSATALQAIRHLLDLLDRRAPVERIAQVVTRAAAGGASHEDLVHIERATESTLRIRSALAEHQRREAELGALFDTASDLAQLRDTDAVLRSIVHRARLLLRTDIAYLSLNDPAADRTYMRVTDGSTSALFQQVILGMGEGLGGLVAQTARPYATANYAADKRFNHTGPIDAAVVDERLVAILGVPLRVGATVIGVLYAADRSSRDFTTDDVSLLVSLANHAAIALDTARLLEESRSALEELNAASQTIRAHHDALRRAQDAHDRLSEVVLRGGDAPEVAAALASVLGGGILMHDVSGAELARVGAAPQPQAAGPLRESRASGRAVRSGDTWVCAVQAGPEPLGSITLTDRTDLGDADRRLFERAGVVTALLLLLRRSVADAEDRVRGELVTDLLTAPDRNPAGLVDRGRRLGVDLRAPHVVAVAHAEECSRRRLAAVALTRVPAHSLVGVHADRVVLVVPDERPDGLAQRLAGELGGALDCPVTVGAGGPAEDPAALVAAHAEAERCLRALLALGRVGHGGAASGLGFVGVLLGGWSDVDGSGGANIDGFVRTTLGPVLDYDARRGTDLLHTLRAYFDCGGNLSRTKDELHVHVNTVTQRLERIGSLLDPGWAAPDRILEIQLALRLHLLRR